MIQMGMRLEVGIGMDIRMGRRDVVGVGDVTCLMYVVT